MRAFATDWPSTYACTLTTNPRRPPHHEPRRFVDFASVPPSQWEMHDRLDNWARWCRGRQGQFGGASSPMFDLYRSDNWDRAYRYGDETVLPVDNDDAQHIAKAVFALPVKHRKAIHWSYLHPRDPMTKARELAVSLQGLAQLVVDGRQMLINRGV